mgnify:CR=1 FL=1
MELLTINNLWMMLCTALVFFMHLGFAFLEIGLTRQKNTINIIKDDYTQQFNYGVVKVKDGQIDLEEFDKQIPNDYRKYNTHIFLEDFDIVKVFGFKVIVPIFGS